MTDIIDLAQQREQMNMARSLLDQAARASTYARPKAIGRCLNDDCQAAFHEQPARLFCGPVCAEQFEIQSRN